MYKRRNLQIHNSFEVILIPLSQAEKYKRKDVDYQQQNIKLEFIYTESVQVSSSRKISGFKKFTLGQRDPLRTKEC